MLSCSTVPFDGYDIGLAVAKIAELGFEGVELGFIEGYVGEFSDRLFEESSVRVVRSALAHSGVSCPAVSGHIDLSASDAVARTALRLRFASQVGAPRLVTNAAVRSGERAFYRNMEQIIREAERCSVTICLENPGNGVANVVNDAETGARVMRRIDHPLVKINYDFANTASHFPIDALSRFPAERDFLDILPWLEELHLKDFRLASNGDFEYPALGDGEIDLAAVFDRLAEAEKQPLLSLELPLRLRRHPDGSPYRLRKPVGIEEIIGTLSRSRAFVLRLLEAHAGA